MNKFATYDCVHSHSTLADVVRNEMFGGQITEAEALSMIEEAKRDAPDVSRASERAYHMAKFLRAKAKERRSNA